MKKLLFFFLWTISNILFADKTSTTLTFATEATYPPFVYLNTKGEVEGFDAAIVKALCEQMKTTCRLINQPWESLIPSLKLGKVDGIFGGLAITKSRAEEVDFTKPYYINSVSMIIPIKENFSMSNDSLKGKVIGVQSGTTFDKFLQEQLSNVVTIHRYASLQDALLDLNAHRVDYVLGDTPVLQTWITSNKQRFQLVGVPIKTAEDFGTGNGIAVRKGNSDLLNALNNALFIIKGNGVYNTIVKTYLPAVG